MSAVPATARVPGGGDGRAGRAPLVRAPPRSRPAVRIAAFFALGLYGALRWSSLLTPRPTWRLIGMLSLAALAAALLGSLARRGPAARALAVLGAVAVAVAALGLSGVPLSLLRHGHVHAIAAGISEGLVALPRVTVPYGGIDDWARIVVLLGAAVLMLDAGMLLAFAPPTLGDARRASAALPLIALAVVPSTLLRPSLPYLHGLLLLGLLAALVWGERLERGGAATAILLVTLAGGIGLAAAPALDRHRPWVDYQSIAGAFSASNVETFDWSQRYGPIVWPRTGREILDVRARRPDYWKAENLDTFNGTAWVQGPVETGNLVPGPDASAAARWTQTLRVTVRGMQTTDMIAAGYAAEPRDAPQAVLVGASPGTWTTSIDLGPGDTYLVDAYSPDPSTAQLAAAGGSYPDTALVGYRSMVLPPPAAAPFANPQILFPPFHSSAPAQSLTAQLADDGGALMKASPYAGAYELSQQLARRARTPLAFVQAVEHYLARGFTYGENPPRRQYPLESFLFADKLGYCQQFSGAMALLLRMGGVPARVAAGFTPGNYDPTSHQWIVSDLDAHAWVEVWFPHYGWVRFDPTPSAAPALAGKNSAAALAAVTAGRGRAALHAKRRPEPVTPPANVARHTGGAPAFPLVILLALMLGAGAFAMHALRRSGPRDADALVVELERALMRSGRPLSPGTTLAQLERRFRSSPEAAGYVRALLRARYGGAPQAPSAAGRRALRARLADGLGPSGRMRALWALPPRFSRGS